MTDEHSPAPDPSGDHGSPESPSTNGLKRADVAAVRSGLAHRRNPVGVFLSDLGQSAARTILRDPLATFLVIASLGLAIAFATLLGDIKPSSAGRQVPISAVQSLAKHRDISNALLLDHDNRVEVTTKPSSASAAGGSAAGGAS